MGGSKPCCENMRIGGSRPALIGRCFKLHSLNSGHTCLLTVVSTYARLVSNLWPYFGDLFPFNSWSNALEPSQIAGQTYTSHPPRQPVQTVQGRIGCARKTLPQVASTTSYRRYRHDRALRLTTKA